MINRRCRRCCCMNNNSQNYSQNMMETSCNNIPSSNDYNSNSCECGFDEEMDVFPSEPMLAQSYVPWQYMNETFKACTGLDNGTIFPELVSPYMPCDSMRDIEYLRNTNKIGEGCNAWR